MRAATQLRHILACRRLRQDESGATMVEFTIVMMVLFIVVLGIVDFGYALYQWNGASKAVQLGARIAAVSTPVDSSLVDEDAVAQAEADGGTALLGDPLNPEPYFDERVCSGNPDLNENCDYDAVAMANLIDGYRATDPRGLPGMRNIFPRVTDQNVVVRYAHTGLGFYGRPGISGCPGMVPTVTVEVRNIEFEFFFLAALLGLGTIEIPRMHTTVTGEDLCTAWE